MSFSSLKELPWLIQRDTTYVLGDQAAFLISQTSLENPIHIKSKLCFSPALYRFSPKSL
jgi:hypothetical protein